MQIFRDLHKKKGNVDFKNLVKLPSTKKTTKKEGIWFNICKIYWTIYNILHRQSHWCFIGKENNAYIEGSTK